MLASPSFAHSLLFLVTAGLDPVVHAEVSQLEPNQTISGISAWIAGSSPAMTNGNVRAPSLRAR
jgi:hypothetical protein